MMSNFLGMQAEMEEDDGPDGEQGLPLDVSTADFKGTNARYNPPMMAFSGLRQVQFWYWHSQTVCQ